MELSKRNTVQRYELVGVALIRDPQPPRHLAAVWDGTEKYGRYLCTEEHPRVVIEQPSRFPCGDAA